MSTSIFSQPSMVDDDLTYTRLIINRFIINRFILFFGPARAAHTRTCQTLSAQCNVQRCASVNALSKSVPHISDIMCKTGLAKGCIAGYVCEQIGRTYQALCAQRPGKPCIAGCVCEQIGRTYQTLCAKLTWQPHASRPSACRRRDGVPIPHAAHASREAASIKGKGGKSWSRCCCNGALCRAGRARAGPWPPRFPT